MGMVAAQLASPPKTKIKFIKRLAPDKSQRLRRAFQLAFLALNVWIGVAFVLFVHYYESGGRGMRVARPAGVEGWLPIASLMNLKLWVSTGRIPRVHPAGMFLLVAFLAISWLLRKSFCAGFVRWVRFRNGCGGSAGRRFAVTGACPAGSISRCAA